jgi:hypothetical protein
VVGAARGGKEHAPSRFFCKISPSQLKKTGPGIQVTMYVLFYIKKQNENCQCRCFNTVRVIKKIVKEVLQYQYMFNKVRSLQHSVVIHTTYIHEHVI